MVRTEWKTTIRVMAEADSSRVFRERFPCQESEVVMRSWLGAIIGAVTVEAIGDLIVDAITDALWS